MSHRTKSQYICNDFNFFFLVVDRPTTTEDSFETTETVRNQINFDSGWNPVAKGDVRSAYKITFTQSLGKTLF